MNVEKGMAKPKCKINHKDPDCIPKFLCRVCTPISNTNFKGEVVEFKPKLDPRLAALDDDVRAYAEKEIAAGRLRVHWFDEPGTAERITREARRVTPTPSAERVPRAPKAQRAQRPSDTFTLAELASERKHEPRIYRAAARNIKDALTPLQVSGMKYVYAKGDKQRVLDFIQQELERQCKPKTSPKKSSPKSSTRQTGRSSTAATTAITKAASGKKGASSRKVSRTKSKSSSSKKATKKKR